MDKDTIHGAVSERLERYGREREVTMLRRQNAIIASMRGVERYEL
jgi:hypothetical protein